MTKYKFQSDSCLIELKKNDIEHEKCQIIGIDLNKQFSEMISYRVMLIQLYYFGLKIQPKAYSTYSCIPY